MPLVIKIPAIAWKKIFSFRLLFLSVVLATLAYWFLAIRPYLWIPDAKVAAFSLPVSPDLAGRITQIGPLEGEQVQKGQLLFAFDMALLRFSQRQLQYQLDTLNEKLRTEQQRMEEAMQHYLEAPEQENFAVFEEAQVHAEKLSSELAVKQTEWEALEVQTQKLAFRAPFDGFVLNRSVQEGAVVSFGQPLYVLCDPSRFWIEAYVPEKTFSRLSLGDPIRIRLPAFPQKEWEGTLSWIGPTATAHGIPVKVSVEDPTFPVRPGLSAKVGLKVH